MMADEPKNQNDKKIDIGQDASIDDKDRKDRPGSANGQPATNADYDYRPDSGTTGGAAANDTSKVLDGKPVEQTPKQEGDKPDDLKKPVEKWAGESAKK
jgi:hypothetical protein